MENIAIEILNTRMQQSSCRHYYKPLIKVMADQTLGEVSNSRLFRLKQHTLDYAKLDAEFAGSPHCYR